MEFLGEKKKIPAVLRMFPPNICGLAFQKECIFSKSWELSLFSR